MPVREQQTEDTPRPDDPRQGDPGQGAGVERTNARLMPGMRLETLSQPHFWLVAGMLAAGALLSYGQFLAPLAGNLPFVLTRYAMERILFLLPVIYGTFVFGVRGGGLTLAVAALLLIHEALIYSPNPVEALLESTAILLVAGAILVAFQGLQKVKARRQEMVATLEVARQELSHHIEVIKKNERQLSAINKVCRVVAESLDLFQTLDRILDEVLRLADVEIAMIYLKNLDTQELELAAHRGVSEAFAQAAATLNVGKGFNGAVAETGSPMTVDDASADRREYVHSSSCR
ncbi:MAG: domain S-box protein [Dehalococcoidia bacterium]|nr:domain S-box protein [Dehalococcoidia bacterium]